MSSAQSFFPKQLFTSIGIYPFDKLELTKGWVINSVMSKVTTAIRVTRSPPYGELFDEDGMLDNGFSAADPRWNDLTHETGETEQEEEKKEVWVTTHTPTFDMIRIPYTSRGEVPNVNAVQKDGEVLCYCFWIQERESVMEGCRWFEWTWTRG